ncbi:MAG TPA: LON peptidase substrate-binding domain-containing protein, partial [Coriobacteriia bacterium]
MSSIDDIPVEFPDILPLIPLKDLVLFPNLVVPLFVGREKSLLALEEALRGDHHVALVLQHEPEMQDPGRGDIHSVGCVGTVLQELKLPDGTAKALVEGVVRIRILEYVTDEPYLQVRVERIEEEVVSDVETVALMRALVADFEKAAELGKPIPQEVLMAAGAIEEPGRLADFIAFHLNLKSNEKQAILEAVEPTARIEQASGFLRQELQILELGSKIQNRVKESLNASQREFFLREQMKAIQQELGSFDETQAELDEYREKIAAAHMPEAVEAKALKEMGRLEKMPA